MIRNKLLRLNIHSVTSILAFLGGSKIYEKITNQSLLIKSDTTYCCRKYSIYVQTEIKEKTINISHPFMHRFRN